MKTNIRLRRPSEEAMLELLDRCESAPTTNPPGLLDRPVQKGFHRGVWQRELPHKDFGLAKNAIRSWAAQHAAGIELTPPQPPIIEDQTVVLLVRTFPAWITAACRIISVVDTDSTFGFTYSTLAHHPEDGEESFLLERRPDNSLSYTVTAVARPAAIETKAFPPATRFMQNRANTAYLLGVATYRGSDPTRR